MNATDKHYRRKEFAVDEVAAGGSMCGKLYELREALDATLKRRGLSVAFNYCQGLEEKEVNEKDF